MDKCDNNALCGESKIRDLSLAEYGRKEIEIAEVEMPGILQL